MTYVPKDAPTAPTTTPREPPIPLTQITGTPDCMASAPSVLVEHLAGFVSFEEMLGTRDELGRRPYVLDYCELPALRDVLEARGAHEIASDLSEVLRHLPAGLVGWRRLIVTRDPDNGSVVIGAISRSVPALVVDFWIACHDDGVMVSAPNERLSSEVSFSEWSIYADGTLIQECLGMLGDA